MIDIVKLQEIARNCSQLQSFSPEHELAKVVCELRGISPYGTVYTAGITMQSWQGIVLESKMQRVLMFGGLE